MDHSWQLHQLLFNGLGRRLDRIIEDLDKNQMFLIEAEVSVFHESDLIEAVISAAFDRIHQMQLRMDQLRRFASESPEFEPLVLTSKRVTNILKNEKRSFEVNPTLFAETCEFALWEKYRTLEGAIRGCLEKGEFHDALNLLVGLIQPVSDLFDGVEILTKTDPALRENRLGLLQRLAALFLSLADFLL